MGKGGGRKIAALFLFHHEDTKTTKAFSVASGFLVRRSRGAAKVEAGPVRRSAGLQACQCAAPLWFRPSGLTGIRDDVQMIAEGVVALDAKFDRRLPP